MVVYQIFNNYNINPFRFLLFWLLNVSRRKKASLSFSQFCFSKQKSFCQIHQKKFISAFLKYKICAYSKKTNILANGIQLKTGFLILKSFL